MNIFKFRDQIIHDYATYIKSFIQIRDPLIREHVGQNLDAGILWPEPLIQLTPTFEPGEWIETLVTQESCMPSVPASFVKIKALTQTAEMGSRCACIATRLRRSAPP